MGQKMEKAPVYFTLVQVRFSRVMALESYAAKVQEQFRMNGFPDAYTGAHAVFNLNIGQPDGSTLPQVPVERTARYKFGNIAKTAAFILDEQALTFQTSTYETFHEFLESFLKGLKIFHDIVGLSFTDRIGIRYLDAVYPNQGEDLSLYLNKSLLGLYKEIEGELVHSFSETAMKKGSFNVLSRVIIQNGSVGIPPDLLPMELVIDKRFQNLSGQHAILDIDGSYNQRDAFELDQVKERLSEVHAETDKAFKVAVTDHALQMWK